MAAMVYMQHSEEFAKELLRTDFKSIGEEMLRRLGRDQHEMYHDAEFHPGCTHCEAERRTTQAVQ